MKEKKLYLELLRAGLMFLVILTHTGTRGFFLFSVSEGSPLYAFYLCVSMLCQCAVPVYWMISGAVLLPKEESLARLYRRRVLRMAVTLLLFSLLYHVWLVRVGLLDSFSPRFFLDTLYTGQWAASFWFLYAYLGMLMLLPLLRRMVKAMPRGCFLYLLALVLVMRGVRPIAEFLLSGRADWHVNPRLTENLFGFPVLYVVMGYYFADVLEDREITGRGALRWLGAGLLGLAAVGLMTVYKIRLTGDASEANAQTFYETLLCLPVFAIFYTARFLSLHLRAPGWLRRVILTLGGCAFGIMLWEGILRYELDFVYLRLAEHIPGFLACLAWVAAVYLCGAAITLVLKRVPGINRLL